MQDLSWKFFAHTGNIQAYLMYKEAVEAGGDEFVQRSDHEMMASEIMAPEEEKRTCSSKRGES